MEVFRSDPTQRGFSQPCPLWQGECTIYLSAHYPHICRAYKCKLLKEMLAENTALSEALIVVEQAKEMIYELDLLLPISPEINFRKRLVACLENPERLKASTRQGAEFRLKADALLAFYEKYFGVNDLLDRPDEE